MTVCAGWTIWELIRLAYSKYSDEVGEAGAVSRCEGDDGWMMVSSKYSIEYSSSSLMPLTLTPAMAIFYRSWCATATFRRTTCG